MGKITGFKEYSRSNYEKISPEVRIKNWGEMREETSDEKIRTQAARCMSCGIPFCSAGIMLPNGASGCPLHNLIPEWNDMVYRGQWQEAYERLSLTNPFPEFTGRVCPAPCEGSCTVGLIGEPVTISSIEYEIIEHAFQNGWVKPAKAPATGKRVAVVGSGPAGLATAHYLTSVGHAVTVFERSDRPGGLLMYGIPNMKLDKDIIQRRLDILEEAGVTFVCNTEIGKDIAAQELVDTYDAVVLCGGATRARGINVEGNDAKGVHMAMDFLTANTQNILAGEPQESKITAKDKHVIVIGGGDTGTDCVGTSIRHGAKSVHQFEIMPQAPDKRDANTNPWPEWPKKLKTDYGQEEAIYLTGSDPRNYEINTTKIEKNEAGEVTAVHTVQIEWKRDALGRMNPVPVEGTEKVWKADLVLLAMGFTGPEDTIPDELTLKRDLRSNIQAAETDYKTNVEKVFTCGDMRRGQSLVVWALQEGKLAAGEVDRFLSGDTAIY